MDLAPGAVIGGKYRIERPLARGGMGSLWVARHAQLGSTVAIKFLDPTFAISPAHRARFEREARAAASLKSPHVVHVQDYGFEATAPYIVMELLEGEDLGHRLHRVRRMSVHDTARILAQVGKALRKAHEGGIAHRDLKPANLFLARVDDEEVVKILDFGIAKEQHSTLGDATRTGEVIGSPHYMSPEQVRAERDVDHRTDLWSLGIILYRMLVGVLPFPGDQLGPVLAKILTEPVPVPTQAAPDLPPAMDAFFARALARDKLQRFQSVAEMIEAFHAAAGGREAMPSISMSIGTGPVPGPAAPAGWGHPAAPVTLTGSALVTASGPLTGAGPMGGSGPITGAGPMGMGQSGPLTGAGPMGGSGPITGAGPMGMGHSGPLTGAGPMGMGHSGPITGAGPMGMGHSGPITGTGAQAAVGQTGPHTGSVTAGGLVSTGAPPRPKSNAGALIAIGAVGVALAGAAVLGFFLLRGPSEDGAAAASSAEATTGAPATSAEPAPVIEPAAPAASSADAAPSATASAEPSAPAEPSASASAEPAASSAAPSAPNPPPQINKQKPPPPKPKEKWF